MPLSKELRIPWNKGLHNNQEKMKVKGQDATF